MSVSPEEMDYIEFAFQVGECVARPLRGRVMVNHGIHLRDPRVRILSIAIICGR